jgi:uncharacterized DUF497 family protein
MENEYEWDEAKRLSNIVKHETDFTAMYGFEWETAHEEESRRYGEERFAATGYIGERLYYVIYTIRGDVRRIISLRKANRREMRDYAQA